jgi:hypothetical protein
LKLLYWLVDVLLPPGKHQVHLHCSQRQQQWHQQELCHSRLGLIALLAWLPLLWTAMLLLGVGLLLVLLLVVVVHLQGLVMVPGAAGKDQQLLRSRQVWVPAGDLG